MKLPKDSASLNQQEDQTSPTRLSQILSDPLSPTLPTGKDPGELFQQFSQEQKRYSTQFFHKFFQVSCAKGQSSHGRMKNTQVGQTRRSFDVSPVLVRAQVRLRWIARYCLGSLQKH